MRTHGMPEKMHRALRKLQHNIMNAQVLNYHSLHHHHHHHATSTKRSAGGSQKNENNYFQGGESIKQFLDNCEDVAPHDVPEGFLVVYVGEERRRFVISANILSHSVFRMLLNKSAEEFGFKHEGGLNIACEVVFFEHLLWLIETNDPSLSSMEIDEVVGHYAYSEYPPFD